MGNCFLSKSAVQLALPTCETSCQPVLEAVMKPLPLGHYTSHVLNNFQLIEAHMAGLFVMFLILFFYFP